MKHTQVYRFLPIALYVYLLAVFYAGHPWLDFPLDDAWIHAVYAESVAHGEGLCYNSGVFETGSTSPLWVIATAWIHWIPDLPRESVALYVKFTGFLLGLVVIINVRRIADLVTENSRLSLIAASCMAFDSSFLFSTASGMENMLLLALLTTAIVNRLARRYIAFCGFLGLAVVTRPEAVVFGLFTLIDWLRFIRTNPFRTIASASLFAVIPAIWIAFCLMVTHHPLPQTFYAKAVLMHWELFDFVSVFFQSLSLYGLSATPLFAVGLCGVLWMYVKECRKNAFSCIVYLIAIPLIYLIAVLFSRLIDFSGYYWTRWLDPPLQMLTIAACIGVAWLIEQVAHSCTKNSKPVMVLIIMLLFIVSSPLYFSDFFNRKDVFRHNCININQINVQSGLWLKQNTAGNAVCGLNDAGAIRYFSRRKCIDFTGLNTASAISGQYSFSELLNQCDWLAIFPSIFQQGDHLAEINDKYTISGYITISPTSYSIAKIRRPLTFCIYQKNKDIPSI
ncbi:MAG: hypothetical protein EOL87_04930 [Spartobacteria bacterium]|nr:hypothetical protein [Spartobacteria bacterium]